jgi:hypothetical protein
VGTGGSNLIPSSGESAKLPVPEQSTRALDGCAFVPSALHQDFKNLAFIITEHHKYICLPAIGTTISSKCQRLLGRGRRRRSLRAIIGPNFSTQLIAVTQGEPEVRPDGVLDDAYAQAAPQARLRAEDGDD